MAPWKAGCAGLIGVALTATPAFAEEPAPSQAEAAELRSLIDAESQRLAEQVRILQEQEAKLAAQRRSIEDLQRRLDAMRGVPPQPDTAAAQPQQQPAAAPMTVAQNEVPAGPVGQAPEAPERPPEIAPIFESPGVLTPKGRFVLEPSLQFTHATNNRVALIGFTIIPAITIGLIDIRKVSRDTMTAAITGRYGLTNRLELEGRVPYVHRRDSTIGRPLATPTANDTVFESKGKGIGDIEFAARYQLNEGGVDRPYYVAGLRLKSRTGKDPFEVAFDPVLRTETEQPLGTGFWGIQPSFTVIYPSDPAVFFGTLSYMRNLKRTIGIRPGDTVPLGEVDPGDIFGFNFGMGMSMNERASFSLGYDHAIVGRTKIAGTPLPDQTATTHIGTLLFGLSYRVTERSNLNFSVGVGATREAPDLQLTVRLPYSF